jgi:hypothetical protein
MPMPTPMSPDDLERLVADLDAGAYDGKLAEQLGADITPAPFEKFADVRAWAERKGVPYVEFEPPRADIGLRPVDLGE